MPPSCPKLIGGNTNPNGGRLLADLKIQQFTVRLFVLMGLDRPSDSGARWCNGRRIRDQSGNGAAAKRPVTHPARNSFGSIEAGKSADLTVLEQDPFEIEPMKLGDVAVRARC